MNQGKVYYVDPKEELLERGSPERYSLKLSESLFQFQLHLFEALTYPNHREFNYHFKQNHSTLIGGVYDSVPLKQYCQMLGNEYYIYKHSSKYQEGYVCLLQITWDKRTYYFYISKSDLLQTKKNPKLFENTECHSEKLNEL